MWKTPLVLLFGSLAIANSFLNFGPMLEPPRLMPNEMIDFPPHNLYMSPTEVEVPPAWLDFCPPRMFAGLAPPEPWDMFAPLIYEEPEPAGLLFEPEAEAPSDFEPSPNDAPQGLQSGFQVPGASPRETIAAPEPSTWVFICTGAALLVAGALPRRSLRFLRSR